MSALSVPLFSIRVAFFYAFSSILAKRGLRHSDPLAASFVTTGVSMIIFIILFAFTVPTSLLYSEAVVVFVIAGITSPSLGRTLRFLAIDRIGPAVAEPLVQTQSLFILPLAILLLGEEVTPWIILGVILIVLGVLNLQSAARHHVGWRQRASQGFLFGVLAALAFTAADILRKLGMTLTASAVLGSTVTTGASLVFLSCFIVASKKMGRAVSIGRAVNTPIIISGLGLSAAWLLKFVALQLGDVVMVSPLSSISPLFTLTLSPILLRGVERITPRVALGAVTVVAGTLVLTLA